MAKPGVLAIKKMSRRVSRLSGVSGLSGTQRLIDVDLLDDPGSRYNIEALLGEGTFGEVIYSFSFSFYKIEAGASSPRI